MTPKRKDFIAGVLIDTRSMRFIQFHEALSNRLKDNSTGGGEFWTEQAKYFRDKGQAAEGAYEMLCGHQMQSVTWDIPD